MTDSRWPFLTFAVVAVGDALDVAIVALLFAVFLPIVAVAAWPAYERAGVGASVLAFAAVVALLRRASRANARK